MARQNSFNCNPDALGLLARISGRTRPSKSRSSPPFDVNLSAG